MRIWKQSLRPNLAYRTQRGWFRPTTEDCRQYVANTRKALKAGGPLPVPLEHQPDADPSKLPLSREAVMAAMPGRNVGFIEDIRQNEDGSIDSLLDIDWIPDGNGQPIRDEGEIRQRLEKSIKFVSPLITPNIIDGLGNEYGSGFGHVCLTTVPVDSGQMPFDGGQPMSKLAGPVAMSLAHAVTLSEGSKMPFPPKDKKEEPEKESKADESTDAEAGGEEEVKDSFGDPVSTENSGGDMLADLKRLAMELQEDGYHIEQTDDLHTLIKNLLISCKTKKLNQQDAGGEDLDQGGNMGAAQAEPQYTALSQTVKRLEEELQNTKRREAVALSMAAETKADKAVAKITRLVKYARVSEARAKEWTAHLTSKLMSLVDDRDKDSRQTEMILAKIDALEESMENDIQAKRLKVLTTDQLELSRYATVAPGAEKKAGEVSAEERKAATDLMAGHFRRTRVEGVTNKVNGYGKKSH